MRSNIYVETSNLLTGRAEFLRGHPNPEEVGYRYTAETGFHVYAKLNLNLQLSASDDMRHAKQYLKVIQAYVAVADACASVQGAIILEVQGEVIHLLLPAGCNAEAVDTLLAFCIAVTGIVEREIRPLAGENWRSFVMAADHGRAILVENGNGASDSIVSLGPAANAPAKRLPETKAGCLNIRTKFLALVGADSKQSGEWAEYDLRDPSSVPRMRKYSSEQSFLTKDAAMRANAAKAINESGMYEPAVRRLSAAELSIAVEPDVTTPLQVQGFCMRADLDGFTKDVEEAFNQGEDGVRKLVARFVSLMGFSDQYLSGRQRAYVRLPWAGDCANMVLLPAPNHTYDFDRSSVQATEPADWHYQAAGSNNAGIWWRDLLLKSDWAVGIVGGGSNEGNEGRLLVASITAKTRKFRIVAGWGAGRSLCALDVAGVRGQDTVIHKEDYSALSAKFQPFFRPAGSNFYKAADLNPERLKKAAISMEAKATGVVVPSTGIMTPKPRPHYL